MKQGCTGATELNGFLKSLSEELIRIFNLLSQDGGVPNPETLRIELKKFVREVKADDSKTFFAVWEEFVAIKKANQSYRTFQRYRTLENHLKKFEKLKHSRLHFDALYAHFYDKFLAFLVTEKKLVNNTTGKYIAALKTFLRWAEERGFHANKGFAKFKSPKEDADIVYLTWDELMRLYNFDFGINMKLARVRNVFCFGCFTSQRYSDLAAMKPAHIHDGKMWKVRTQKTRDVIAIPLNEYAREIIDRYRDEKGFIPVISNLPERGLQTGGD